jgi:hypothetical protein
MKDDGDRPDADVVTAPALDRVTLTWESHYDDLPPQSPRPHRRRAYAARQCLACGVLAECDPSRPCAACGASHFHLIPPAR